MSESGRDLVATIFFDYPDGQVQESPVYTPESVEIDAGWVHLVTYDKLGGKTPVRSWPSHQVSQISWGAK